MDSVTILILFLQAVRLSGHRGRMCFSRVSSELQPLPPEGTGPELQSSRRKRIEASLCWTGGSTLQTGETQVRRCLCFYIPLNVMLLNTEQTSKYHHHHKLYFGHLLGPQITKQHTDKHIIKSRGTSFSEVAQTPVSPHVRKVSY